MNSNLIRLLNSTRRLSKLSHVDSSGKVSMVDVTDKTFATRRARASCRINLSPAAFAAVYHNKNTKKGDIVTVAKVAGISAAKNTSSLIPLCHQINLTHVAIDIRFPEVEKQQQIATNQGPDDRNGQNSYIEIESTCTAKYATGVEMEALMACNVTALTIYDMIKAVDSASVITDLKLVEKIKS